MESKEVTAKGKNKQARRKNKTNNKKSFKDINRYR
jgi:hypothetical protein